MSAAPASSLPGALNRSRRGARRPAVTGGGSASYPRWMTRWPLAWALALVILPSGASAAGPPLWLQRAAQTAAQGLSDGTTPVSIAYVAPRSRFPRVVLTGHFVCTACSHGPNGAAPPTGTVAELRFDGKTHLSRDFALCGSRAVRRRFVRRRRLHARPRCPRCRFQRARRSLEGHTGRSRSVLAQGRHVHVPHPLSRSGDALCGRLVHDGGAALGHAYRRGSARRALGPRIPARALGPSAESHAYMARARDA